MLKINKELCIGCGICEEQCAFGAIEIVDGVAEVGDNCTLCGACVEACEPEAMVIKLEGDNLKTDLNSWSGVWIFCEFRKASLAPVSLELLGIGRKLADKRGVSLGAVLIGSKTGDTAKELIGYGADTVYVIIPPLYPR